MEASLINVTIKFKLVVLSATLIYASARSYAVSTSSPPSTAQWVNSVTGRPIHNVSVLMCCRISGHACHS